MRRAELGMLLGVGVLLAWGAFCLLGSERAGPRSYGRPVFPGATASAPPVHGVGQGLLLLGRDMPPEAGPRTPTVEAPDSTPAPAPTVAKSPPALWTGEGLPPDVLEHGPGVVVLRLVERESRAELRGEVALWRLDAPGNRYWARGDRLQALVRVEVPGTHVRRLPLGRYAAVCESRWDTAEPQHFTVGATSTEVALVVDLPRTKRVWLDLIDAEFEQPIRRATVASGPPCALGSLGQATPLGYVARRVLSGPEWGYGTGSGSSSLMIFEREAEAGATRMLVAECEEDTRGVQGRLPLRVEVPGRCDVALEVRGRPFEPDERWLAVVIDPDRVARSLRRPDGRSPDPTALRITSRALQWTPDLPVDAWRDVPIEVELKDPTYHPLSFTFTLRDGELPTREIAVTDRATR